MKTVQIRRSIAPSLSLLISIGLSIGLLGCSTSPSGSNSQQPSLNVAIGEQPPSVPSEQPASSRALTLAQELPITARAEVNDRVIYLEVAETPRQQAIGLMYRTELSDNHGMLFPFTPPRSVSFWMRNVEINLDMIFLKDGQVLAIEAQVPPCRTDICEQYGPRGVAVDNVIELRGGRASELGIEVGDELVITELVN